MAKTRTLQKTIKFCNKTDLGREREHNEDYYGYFSTPNGELVIVADGMGGYGGGEIASVMAVEIISEYVKNYQGSDHKKMLDDAIQLANKKIYEKSLTADNLRKMGTTVVIALIRGNKVLVANVGDSRCYLIRNGKVVWVTKDQTKVQMMLERGWITQEEAEKHPDRHILLQAVGSDKPVDVDFNESTLATGDRLLLCSDGLSEYINNEEMGKLASGELDNVCDRLINLANQRGGSDNITVQVVEYVGAIRPTIARRKFLPLKIAMGVVGILAILILGFFVGLYVRDKLLFPNIEHKIKFLSSREFTEGETAPIGIHITPNVDDIIKISVINQEGWRTDSLFYNLRKGDTTKVWLEKSAITLADSILSLRIESLRYKSYVKDTILHLNIKSKPLPPLEPQSVPLSEGEKGEFGIKESTKMVEPIKKEAPIKKEEFPPDIAWDKVKPKFNSKLNSVEFEVPVTNRGDSVLKVKVEGKIKNYPELSDSDKRDMKPGLDTFKLKILIPKGVDSKEIQKVVVFLYVNGKKIDDRTFNIEK